MILRNEPRSVAEQLSVWVHGRMYPQLYAHLRNRQTPFSLADADAMCGGMVDANCSPRLFQAVLAHCPPLEAILEHVRARCSQGGGTAWFNLPASAAHNSPRLLELLLSLGAGPNAGEPTPLPEWSPLEMAISGGQVRSVRRLLEEPGLDTAMTPRLLELWAEAGTNEDVRRCWRLAAPRTAGVEMPPSGPVPLLEGLTLSYAGRCRNWELAARLCQARGTVSAEEGRALLEELALWWNCSCFAGLSEQEAWTVSALLDALLSACPALIRWRLVQRLLVLCCIQPEAAPYAAQRWAEQIPRRSLALWTDTPQPKRSWFGGGGLLERWRQRLGGCLRPVLDRNREFPHCCSFLDPEQIREALRLCPVRGRPRPGGVSPLARDVLCWGSAGLVLEQLEPGGVLAQEDPAALLALAAEGTCPEKTRGVLLAYVKVRETDPYAL